MSVIKLDDAETKFDVLVANTTRSPKYNIAVLKNVPIVSRRWIDACASSETSELTYEYEKFPFKCFTDCVVCVTGFQLEERKEIQEMVEKNGGEFRADLEKDVVTHLVAKQTNGQAEPTGPKYTHARMWKIFVLSRKWVDECVRRGVKLLEHEYDVKRMDSSLELRKKPPIVVLPTKEELTKQLEEEYDEDKTPWGQHYLFSTKVYLVGFTNSSCNSSSNAAVGGTVDPNDILKPSAKNARLAHKILRAGGATVAMNPQKATHVVVNDDLDCQKDVDFILRTHMRPHREKCVTFEWLKKCSEEGRTMPKSKKFRVAKERFSEVIEPVNLINNPGGGALDDKKTWTEYNDAPPPRRIPERSPLKAIDKDKNPLRRQPTAKKVDTTRNTVETQKETTDKNNNISNNNRRENDKRSRCDDKNANNTMTEQIPETRAVIGETALVNKEDEDDALLLERNGYNSRNESSERSSKQSQQYPLANVKLSLFEGLSIEEKELAVNLISRLGGEYLRGNSTSTSASSDFIICPAVPTTSEKKKLRALASDIATARGEGHDVIFSARFIAPHFLEGVLVEGKLFKPSESMAYQPYMDHKAYFPSMKGVVLSPSSYSEREKCAIKMLSTICGCECTDNLKKGKNTHVVVPKAEGSKYEAGKKWNKKCVTKEWLEESARKGYKVDESLFAPLLPGAMLEETQGEETDTTIEKKTAYAGKEEEEPHDIAPPMDAPMDDEEEEYHQKLPPPETAHQHQTLPTSAMKTPSAPTTGTTNIKKTSLEHLKTRSRFHRTPGPSTAKKTPGSQNACVSQQTNGNNKNVAAIPIQKIAPTTAKKSPSKQLTSQQQQQHVKSSSVVKRNHQSQHRSSPQPSIDGKRKLPLTSTTTQKKKYNNTSLSPLFDEEDDNGNVNHAKPSPMNLFNNDTTNNEAANTRNANLNALMMKSPSPAKNTNNTNEDDGFDLVLPNLKATLPNTLNIAPEPGSARKNFGGAGENSTLNMETQVGYGNTALNHHHRHHHHHQSTSKLETLRNGGSNKNAKGALKNLIGGFRGGGKSPGASPLADPTTDIDSKDEWMK